MKIPWDKKIPFATTQLQRFNIETIRASMVFCDLDPDFVKDSCELASYDQGVYELLELWVESPNEEEEEATLEALRQVIKDYNKP